MKFYWFLWVPAWILFFIAGILTSLYPPQTLLLFLSACISLGYFIHQYRQLLNVGFVILVCCLSLLSFGIGLVRTNSSLQQDYQLKNVSGKSLILEGRVIDWPVLKSKSMEFPIKVNQYKLIAVLPLQTESGFYDIAKGDTIRAKGTLTQQKNQYTSPLSDTRKLEQANAQGFFQIEETNSLLIQRDSLYSHFQRIIRQIREHAWEKLCSYKMDSAYTHFLGALWLGLEKENFPLQPLFQKIGLSHILAISGSNFYWLAGIFLALFTLLKWKEQKKSTVIILILFVYCALVGFQASTTRALLMISLMLIARSKLEGYHSLYAMLYTAWIMLLWNPMWLSDVGFQLSFIGCSAFILFPTPLTKGLGATITTTPLVAYRFNLISLSSLLTNILVLPILTFFYLLVWAFLLPGKIGFFPLKVGEWLWKVVIWFMQFLTSLPYSFHHIRTFPFWILLSYYLLLFGVLFWSKCSLPAKRITATTMALLFLLPAGLLLFPGKSPYLTVTYLNVGQGDATLIQTRTGKTILIDTGPGKKEHDSFDPGAKVLLPLLRKAGVNCIDLLIITHYHDDHYGGLPAVLEHIPIVKEIVLPNTVSEESRTFQSTFNSRLKNVTLHTWCGHHRWQFSDLVLELFSPECEENAWSDQENSRSLCFLLTDQSVSFLFTGDIEADTESKIVDQYGEKLRCTILKIPHHGSQTSSCQAFIETVQPQFAVISCGSKALFRHPSDQTLTLLEELQIPYHITFLQDSLQIVSDGTRYEISPDIK